VCSRNWNSKLCSPSLRTFTTVCRLSFASVTLYCSPKSSGHALRASSEMLERSRPKSSLTELEPRASSEADLPRNSQRDVRAKPCCGREDVGWPDLGGGPKTYSVCQQSINHCNGMCTGGGQWLTHWEDDWNTSSHSLAPIQRRLLTQPEILCFASIALPARHSGAIQQNLDAFARRQCRNHFGARSRADDVNLWSRSSRRGRTQCGRTVGAVDHG
jgi:hypothetical protein